MDGEITVILHFYRRFLISYSIHTQCIIIIIVSLDKIPTETLFFTESYNFYCRWAESTFIMVKLDCQYHMTIINRTIGPISTSFQSSFFCVCVAFEVSPQQFSYIKISQQPQQRDWQKVEKKFQSFCSYAALMVFPVVDSDFNYTLSCCDSLSSATEMSVIHISTSIYSPPSSSTSSRGQKGKLIPEKVILWVSPTSFFTFASHFRVIIEMFRMFHVSSSPLSSAIAWCPSSPSQYPLLYRAIYCARLSLSSLSWEMKLSAVTVPFHSSDFKIDLTIFLSCRLFLCCLPLCCCCFFWEGDGTKWVKRDLLLSI